MERNCPYHLCLVALVCCYCCRQINVRNKKWNLFSQGEIYPTNNSMQHVMPCHAMPSVGVEQCVTHYLTLEYATATDRNDFCHERYE